MTRVLPVDIIRFGDYRIVVKIRNAPFVFFSGRRGISAVMDNREGEKQNPEVLEKCRTKSGRSADLLSIGKDGK